MNEQIKNIAERSGFMMWEDEPWKPEGAIVDWSCNYDAELETLVKNVVRECMNICEELGDKGLDGHYCVDKIKEHFGIEV